MRRVLATIAVLVLVSAACDAAEDGTDAADATEAGADLEVVASAGCEGGEGTEGPHELTHDGIPREYVVHLPDGYDHASPAPLLFNLHGLGSNIEQQDAYSELPTLAGARGYVVVTPQGEGLRVPGFEGQPFWNILTEPVDVAGDAAAGVEDPQPDEIGADDVGFFSELTDHLLAELCVDERRIFSAGMSNGAGMSAVLGCELDDRITAIAPVAGVNLTFHCTGTAPVSVIALHGDADEIVAYEGDFLLGFQLGNPSVPEAMDAWAARNGCDQEPVVDDEREGIVVTSWSGCDGRAEVELWTLESWGHAWPRGAEEHGPGSLAGTELVLDFFDRVTNG